MPRPPILSGSKDRFHALAFSPDGELLYYLRQTPGEGVSRLVELPVLGGTERLVNPNVASGISFAPDGERFVFLRFDPRDYLTRVIVGTLDGEEEVLAEMGSATEHPRFAAWSPDGETIALTLHEGARSYLAALPVKDPTARRRLSRESWDKVGRPVWLPAGDGLIFDAMNLSGTGGRPLFRLSYPSGRVERLTHDLGYYYDPTVTADGSALAVVQRHSRFQLWRDDPADEEAAEPLTSGSGNHGRYGVACAPDGGIIFDSDVDGLHLRRVGMDGSGDRRLTEVGEITVGPAISHDSRWLVYFTVAEELNIWKVPYEGGRAVRLTDGRAECWPAIGRDGRVYYLDYNREKPGIASVPLEGGEPEAFGPVENLFGQPKISPDGSRLLYMTYDPETYRFGVQIVALPDAKALEKLDLEGSRADWAPDGKAVTYVVWEGGISNVWSQPLAGGEPTQLTDYDSLKIESYCWAADGKTLVMSRGEYSRDVVLMRNFG